MLCIELYLKALGDRECIKNHTWSKVKSQILPTLLVYLAALVVAIMLFIQPESDGKGGDYKEYDKGYRHLASEYDAKSESSYEKYDSATESLWTISDLPLTLTAAAYLLSLVLTAWHRFRVTGGKGDIRNYFVPNNVDYVIHRYGEWTLLMIGEGVLSLLIVETVESREYYTIASLGILTVILIQILKFESEPAHAEGHAMWQNLLNSMCYSYLIQLLSMSLILFGVTYKVFLKAILKDSQKDAEASYGYPNESRMLAASPKMSDDTAAHLFAYSLSVVVLSLELICLTHAGVKKAFDNLVHRPDGETAKPHWPVVFIALFKAGIISFTITMSSWTADPVILTACGCLIVFSLAVTRVANFFFIHRKEQLAHFWKETRNTLMSVGDVAQRVSVATTEVAATTVSKSLAPVSKSLAPVAGPQSILFKTLSTSSDDSTPANDDKSSTDSAPIESDKAGSNGSAHGVSTAILTDVSSNSAQSKKTVVSTPDLASARVRRASEGVGGYDAVVVADLHGVITHVDDSAVDLFGYATKHEMLGKNLSILVGGGYGKHHDKYIKAFKQKADKIPRHEVLGQQRMLRGCKADGSEFPCIIRVKMVSDNTKMAGYITDLSKGSTENTKKPSSKEKDELVMKVVDDHAFDAIVVFDDSGTIEMVNQVAVDEIKCKSKLDLVGKNISLIVHDITVPQLLESNGKQRLVTMTRCDGTNFQSILGSKKIEGTKHMFALYIRNIDPVRNDIV
jgi:PAS domain S-box-containing protein